MYTCLLELKAVLSSLDICHCAGGGLLPTPLLPMGALQQAPEPRGKNWPEEGSRARPHAAPGPDPVMHFPLMAPTVEFCSSELFWSVLMIPF